MHYSQSRLKACVQVAPVPLFSDKEAWSICHFPLPYCLSRTHDRTYNIMYTWVRMVRDSGINYSKYTVDHVHVVQAGWSSFYKSENIGTLPYSSGFTVRTGYMLKKYIITLGIRQCVALSAAPYDKDIRCQWLDMSVRPPIFVALPFAQTPCWSNLS